MKLVCKIDSVPTEITAADLEIGDVAVISRITAISVWKPGEVLVKGKDQVVNLTTGDTARWTNDLGKFVVRRLNKGEKLVLEVQ